MDLGVADLYPGGIGVQDQAAYFAGKNVDQVSVFRQLALVGLQSRGQMAFQLFGYGQQLLSVLVTDDDGGWAKDLLRQILVFDQIFVVRNEQRRLYGRRARATFGFGSFGQNGGVATLDGRGVTVSDGFRQQSL